MYRTIVVPLDGSPRAEKVLPHVEELAHRFEARVVFVTVLEHHLTVGDWPHGFARTEGTERPREEEIEAYLHSWEGEFREKGLKATKCLEHGPVARAIVGVAEREEADLIAMTSHGRSGLTRVFYGSVAAGVLHAVDRPLLLVRSL